MATVQLAHTSELVEGTLASARALLDAVFDDMTDHDWDHALGGVHALIWDEDELVGHASIVQRRLLHRGMALRTGYVEGLVVRADARGLGHGAAMMTRLEQVARRAYELAALSATDEAVSFYARRGWDLWQGPSSALTPTGTQRTEDDDGSIFVLPLAVALDLDAAITCDWRDGDVW